MSSIYNRAKKAIQTYVDGLVNPSGSFKYNPLKLSFGTPSTDVTNYLRPYETATPQPPGQGWDSDDIIPVVLEKSLDEVEKTYSWAHISTNATGVAPTINASKGIIQTATKNETTQRLILTFSVTITSAYFVWTATEMSLTSIAHPIERTRDTSSLEISFVDNSNVLIPINGLTVGVTLFAELP